MKKRQKKSLSYFIFCLVIPGLLISLPRVLHADQVIMKNGDRLTGKVRKKTRDSLRFKTPYAELIIIQWDLVQSIQTDSPVNVVLDDGSEHLITAVSVNEGSVDIFLAKDGARQTFSGVKVFAIRKTKRKPFSQNFGRINLALKSNRGNGDTDNFDVDFDTTYQTRQYRFRTHGEWEVDTVNERDKKRKWSLDTGLDWFLRKKHFSSLRLNLEQNTITGLDLRSEIGPFYGYQFIQSERFNLLMEAGLFWTEEDTSDGQDDGYTAPAWHIDFDRYFNGTWLQIYHNQTGSVRTGSGRILLDSSTGFRLPIMSGFLLSLKFKTEYNSEPTGEADSTEKTYRMKLGYRW